MPWDINDPYRSLFKTDGDPDAAWLFGPRKLDQYTAEEREQAEAKAQAAMRERQQAAEAEETAAGIYRAPFEPEDNELLTDYARRLAVAATDSDRGKLSECLLCRVQFRIGKGCRGPVLCSQGCLSRGLKADKHRARDKRRNKR